jgi:competence protein ComFC
MAVNKEFSCVKGLWHLMLDMLFPISCIRCGTDGDFLCDKCFRDIPLQKKQVCPLCYKDGDSGPNPPGTVCPDCRKTHEDFALDGLIATCEYKKSSPINNAIHVFKYEFVKDLAAPLSRLMIDFFDSKISEQMEDCVLCAVPLHKKRYNWRGFNQSEILTRNLAAARNFPAKNLLTRISYHIPQMELTKEKRMENVTGAFVCNTGNPPKKVLLVDDVATTLSTLNSCAASLKDAGTESVFGLVLARVY